MFRSLYKAGMWVGGALAIACVGCSQPDSSAPAPGAMPRYLGSGQTVELNATTYFAHGHLLERQGMFERAAEQYEKALAVQPNFVTALNRLGVTLNKLARHAEASERFRQALELNPGEAYLYNNLGFSLYLEGDYAQAEQTIARALDIDPTFARARMNHAIVLARLGRFDDAFTELALVGTKADACFNMGLLLAEAQRFDEAQQYFAAALQADPHHTLAEEQLRIVRGMAADNDARIAATQAPQQPAMLRAGTTSLAAARTATTTPPPGRATHQRPVIVQPPHVTREKYTPLTTPADSTGAQQAADVAAPTPPPATMTPARSPTGAKTGATRATTPSMTSAPTPKTTPAPAKTTTPAPMEMQPVSPPAQTNGAAGTARDVSPPKAAPPTSAAETIGEMTPVESSKASDDQPATRRPATKSPAPTPAPTGAATNTIAARVVKLLVEIDLLETAFGSDAAESLWCALEETLFPEPVAMAPAEDFEVVDYRWELMQRVLDITVR